MSELSSNGKAQSEFAGQWKTASEHRAEVFHEIHGMLFGIVVVNQIDIPTFWDKKGDNLNPALNLMTRRRGAESF